MGKNDDRNVEDLISKYSKDKQVNPDDEGLFYRLLENFFPIRVLRVFFHAATHLDCAKEVFSVRHALLILGAVAYALMPLDAVPDLIPFIGLLDDAAVMTGVYALVRDVLETYEKKCM